MRDHGLPRPWRVIYGGSFDPFHQGHRAVVEALLAWGADEVWIVPAARSPFKRQAPGAPDTDRIRMCHLGTAGMPGVRISDIDLRRPAPSYAVDTLEALQREHPGGSWWWAIGEEHLAMLEAWRAFDVLRQALRFAVVARPDLAPAEPLHPTIATIIDRVPMEPMPFSATAIREALASDRPAEGLAESVAAWIRAHGLYRNPTLGPGSCHTGPAPI